MSTLSVSLRPSSFEQFIGNESAIKAIRNQLVSDRLPRAWLFSGPPGHGKTTLARIIASSIGATEVIEKNAADDNGVDAARNLVADAGFKPLSGKYRVVILDEAQQLTKEAQNVLLIPFESKESSTAWILTTTDPAKIIKPLRDRCLSFELKGLNSTEIDMLLDRVLFPHYDAILAPSQIAEHKKALSSAILKASVTSPREILMVVDRFLSGLPAEEAVQNLEEPSEFIEIARAVVRGDWHALSGLLSKVKATDTVGLRACVANYLKSMLLNTTPIKRETPAECIRSLFSYTQGFQDGATHPATVAWLYGCCTRFAKK